MNAAPDLSLTFVSLLALLFVLLGLTTAFFCVSPRHRGFLLVGLGLLACPVLLWLLYSMRSAPAPELQTHAVHGVPSHQHEMHEVHDYAVVYAAEQPAWMRGPRAEDLVVLGSTIMGLFGALWLISRLFDRGSTVHGVDA